MSTFTHNYTTTTPPFIDECYKVTKHWDHLFRPLSDNEFPWLGILFSLPITAIWYWCTDHVIVQRALTAKNLVHARRGATFAGVLKLLPIFLMVIPGMVARVLYPDIIACPDASSCKQMCGDEAGCAHLAYIELVANILPAGLTGLMFAMMLAALMSSVSSTFLGVSSVFTMDIWKSIRPGASDRELLWVARVAVIAIVAVGIAWIPVVESLNKKEAFVYLQAIQAYIAPSICAVFLMGILSRRVTKAGVIISLVIGGVLAIIRFSFDVAYPSPTCGHADHRPRFAKLNFMYFSLAIFGVSVISISVVSVFTQPAPRGLLGKLTWGTRQEGKYEEEDNHIGMDNFGYPNGHRNGNGSDRKVVGTTSITFEETSKFDIWEKRLSFGVLILVLLVLCLVFQLY